MSRIGSLHTFQKIVVLHKSWLAKTHWIKQAFTVELIIELWHAYCISVLILFVSYYTKHATFL